MATKADLESLTGERGELVAALAERNAELAARDAALAAREAKLDIAAAQIAKQAAQQEYMQLQLELKLIKRKTLIASAERVDTTQLQLEFETLTQKLDALAGAMGNPSESDGDPNDESVEREW